MRSVSVRLADLDRVKINLGIAGENEHTHVLFDCKKAFDQYPNATPFLIVTPPRGDIYPAVVTRDGDIVEWVVTDSDLIYHGNGKVHLQFKQGDIIMKSYEAMTSIAKSSEPTGTVPTPIQNWITQANAILASIPDDINAALAAAKASGEFDGADGVGIASITYKSTVGLVDTYTITLTDGSDYDFTVTNGKDGDDGDDGVGIQSIAKTGTVGLVDTYTITLTNGQEYNFTVTNGQGSSIVIDDVTPAADKVFSSAKVAEELTDVKNAIQGLDNFETITNNDITQLKKDGFTTLYPDWETGDWGANGKTSDNGKRRSKTLLHVPKGTYTVNSSIVCAVWGYATVEATSGYPLLWNQTGEKTFEVTNREYIAFVVSWANEGNPITEMYAVVPSALSEVIVQANKTETLAQTNKALLANRTEYSDGIYHAITNGTLTTDKDIGNGIQVGSAVTFNNDTYCNVLEIAVTEGKTYRMKARVYNDYYLFHFTDANDILIEKGGKNTTGATATLVDVVATAPIGATKAYLCGMKNTTILCDVFEPYTIKQIQDMEHKPTRGAYCIMEFNVGDWYEGRYRSDDKTGIIPADETIYANYMGLFNGIFGRYKPDIAMLNEDARYMCLNTHDDDRAFVGQYFRNQYSGLFQSQDKTDVFNTLASAFPMFDLSTRYFTDTESNMRRNYVKGYTYLNGKKVCIISAHLSSDWDTAKLNAAELLTDLQTEDPEYLICCGDFNLLPSVAEIMAFETAGYTVSNGSVTYDGHEYGPGDFIITTSNITVKSVFCDTQKIDASFVEYIDHLPTIAYLEIF